MPEASNPHDALFKATFSVPARAASQLRALLPPRVVATMDLSRLELCPGSFVDGELSQQHSDILFRTRMEGLDAFVFVLYEHQSSPDPLMSFRLLRYMLRVWDRWLAEYRGHHPARLPPILPIVLYHGAGSWTAPVQFAHLIDVSPELLGELDRHIPAFEYLLDDLSLCCDQELIDRGGDAMMSLTLILFRNKSREGDVIHTLRRHAELLLELLREPGWSLGLGQLIRYAYCVGDISRKELADPIGDIAGESAEEVVMTTAEKLRAEGRQEGRQEGLRETLGRLLRHRFEAAMTVEVQTRVAMAGEAELDLWIDRVLTAGTLDDVFAR